MNGGTIVNNAEVVFATDAEFSDGAEVALNGQFTGNGHLTIKDGSLLTVKVGADDALSAKIGNSTTAEDGATLAFVFAPGYVGDYTLFTNELSGKFNLSQDNVIYNVADKEGANGSYVVSKKTVSEIAIATGATMNQAAALDAITSKGESQNVAFNEISDLINTAIQSTKVSDRQMAIDAVTAMSPEVALMVQQVQSDTATQVFSVIGSRLGGLANGKASGDEPVGVTLWAQGLVNRTELDETSVSKGYDADSYGFAMGAESAVNESTKVGGYAYTSTDIDGFLRSTDAKTHTAFVYGEYKPSNWYVNAIASYGWSDYDEDKFVMGNKQAASYDANTFGLQAMTGLDMQVAGMTMTSEVGMRYYRISQDGYTGVLGVRMGIQWQPCSAAVLKPEF